MIRVIIVLGAAVWPGERPSPTLLRRSRKAAQLWAEGGYDRVIASGGVGQHPPSEAEIMRRILTENGVPGDAILLEDRSTSTETNARYSLALLGSLADTRITVVTDGTHCRRAGMIFRDQGARVQTVPADDAAPPPRRAVQVKQCLREMLALAWYRIRRRPKRRAGSHDIP